MFHSVIKRAMPILFAMAGLFIVGSCLMVLGVIAEQWRKDREFEAKLRPSIEFVESIERSKNRLPTRQEFEGRPSAATDWMVDLITKDSADSSFKSHGGTSKRDFCVRIWRGESWTYYYSWNREFDIVDP